MDLGNRDALLCSAMKAGERVAEDRMAEFEPKTLEAWREQAARELKGKSVDDPVVSRPSRSSAV